MNSTDGKEQTPAIQELIEEVASQSLELASLRSRLAEVERELGQVKEYYASTYKQWEAAESRLAEVEKERDRSHCCIAKKKFRGEIRRGRP